MSPRTGRPKSENPKEQRFTIRLDNEVGAKLDSYCASTGKKRAEAIREGIQMLLEKYKK